MEPDGLARVPQRDLDEKVKITKSSRAPRGRTSKFTSLDRRFIVSGFAPMHPDSSDQDTTEQGIMKRFARKLPTPTRLNLYRDLSAHTQRLCDRYLRPLSSVMPFCCNDYTCGSCFLCDVGLPIARKEEYRKAWIENRMGRPALRFFSKIKMFTKAESYGSKLKHARMINSRCDHMKVWFGPYVRSMESVVYQLPFFVKHIPVSQRAKSLASLERDGAKYFIIDYTAFESHMKPEVQNSCEIVMSNHMLKRFPQMARDIRIADTGLNVCTHHSSGITVKIRGRRMSGDMWTSLFNGWTNLSVVTFVMEENGHKLGVTYDIRVEGDDCLLVVYDGQLPTIQDFERIGFTVKLEQVRDTGDSRNGVAFCGLVHAGGQMMRDPIGFLCKFGYALDGDTASPERRRGLLAAKALSSIYETPQCPIIGAIARCALLSTAGANPIFVDDGYHRAPDPNNHFPDFNPCDRARERFAELYKVSPAEQRRVEMEIMTSGNLDVLSTIFAPTAIQRHYWAGWVEVG